MNAIKNNGLVTNISLKYQL